MFGQLEGACRTWCEQVNARPHWETRRAGGDAGRGTSLRGSKIRLRALTWPLGGAQVLADQPSENRSTPDPLAVEIQSEMIGARRTMLPRSRWAPASGTVPGKYGLQVPLIEDQDPVGEFGSTVSTNRSAKQFALGHRGGIFTVPIPAPYGCQKCCTPHATC